MSVQLPDGGKLGTSGCGVEPTDMGGLSIPVGGPSITIPNLPTITEQSVTAPPKEERHRSIKEVFADNDEENDDEEAEDTPVQLRNTKPPPPLRTIVSGSSRHPGSGSGLILQPGSRRDSTKTNRPIVRPMYRKDVFYTGSSRHLALQTGAEPGHQENGHLSTRPSQVQYIDNSTVVHCILQISQ